MSFAWPSDALGSLPLDVYRLLFRAIEYRTLCTCRTLNKTLAAVVRKALCARRYAPQTNDAHIYQCALNLRHNELDSNASQSEFFTVQSTQIAATSLNKQAPGQCVDTVPIDWNANLRCTACITSVLRACALPLGEFLAVIHLYDGANHTQMLLARFDARATLQRVFTLPLETLAAATQPEARRWSVRFMHAHERGMYLLVRASRYAEYVLVCYRHGWPLRVCVVDRTPECDWPRDGPALWTDLAPESCAVATTVHVATVPLQLVLCCRGVNVHGMDQIVMLEVDAVAMQVRRALTLSTPITSNLARYGAHADAPWPRTGYYSGVQCQQFVVDTHGRYVFLSACVGARAALLLFDPRGGVLLACVAFEPLHVCSLATLLPIAEPHACVYVSCSCCAHTFEVRLQSATAPFTVLRIPHVNAVKLGLLLEDGYVLHVTTEDRRDVLVKEPLLVI